MHVLVVDDEPDVLVALSGMLEELGHTVIAVASAEAAKLTLASHPSITLIVTDHGMPRKTGLTLAADAQSGRPDLPVLIVTGYQDLEELENPGHSVLRKPFSLASLEVAIAECTAAKRI